MKNIFFVFVLSAVTFFNGIAQVTSIKVGVDGVTCSMCSKGTEKSIKRLSFVESVTMDLNTTEASIFIKSNQTADFKAIAKAITDAGFTVRYIKFTYTTSSPSTTNFTVGKSQYSVISGNLKAGINYVELVGKDYMNAEQYKQWENVIASQSQSKKGETYFLKVI